MKKICFAVVSLFWCLSTAVCAGETVYRQANNPGNYVRLEKLRESQASADHPHHFDVEQMQDLLRSLRYSKRLILRKDAKNRNVFEWEYIRKFAPLLVEAFGKAGESEAVMWSLVQKRPYFIIRNDKLTQVKMWVENQSLHIKFLRTEAKLQGDYQAKTTGRKLIDQAQEVGVELEPQRGQTFASDSTKEIILALDQDWKQIADDLDAEDERLKQAEEGPPRSKPETASSGESPRPRVSDYERRSAEQRLSELKNLHDKGLISDRDYEAKKAEILKDL